MSEPGEAKPSYFAPGMPEHWWTQRGTIGTCEDGVCEECKQPVNDDEKLRFASRYYPFCDDRDAKGHYRQYHYIVFEVEYRPVDETTGGPLLLLCSKCRIRALESKARERKGCARLLATLLVLTAFPIWSLIRWVCQIT